MTAKPSLVADGESILIHIPMRFKRRGGRKEVITPEGLDTALPADGLPQEALVVALARAHRWQQMLAVRGARRLKT